MERNPDFHNRSDMLMDVADIVFDFDNGSLLKMLKNRGKYIRQNKRKSILK